MGNSQTRGDFVPFVIQFLKNTCACVCVCVCVCVRVCVCACVCVCVCLSLSLSAPSFDSAVHLRVHVCDCVFVSLCPFRYGLSSRHGYRINFGATFVYVYYAVRFA